MDRYLVNRAREDIWCNPGQDKQYIFSLSRITTTIGAINNVVVMEQQISLPIAGRRFHVFSIGNVYPARLGLWLRKPVWGIQNWCSFKDAMNRDKLIVNLYNTLGMEIPRFDSFYMFTNNDSLIVAIPENSKIPVDYAREEIFLKVYSNAYFASDRSIEATDRVETDGLHTSSTGDITGTQVKITQLLSEGRGAIVRYVNGRNVAAIDLLTARPGDTIEYYLDTSIKRVVSLKLSDLIFFHSTRDSDNKYLLHYESNGENIIDFYDDIDIYVNARIDNKLTGFYYHRNQVSSIRMVTHRDYSILASQLVSQMENFRSNLGALPALSDVYIKLYVRHSGYERALVYESNRIQDLYKLKDSDVVDAFVGTISSVEMWRAENLENCDYIRLMSSGFSEITPTLAQNALGYYGAGYISANTPMATTLYSGRQQIDVPYLLQASSTAFEYSADGVCLGKYYHANNPIYNATHPDTRIVEMIYGNGTHKPDVYFGVDDIDIPSNCGYRVYAATITNSVVGTDWVDITGNSALYTVDADNVLHWAGVDLNKFLMIRTDRSFLEYELNITSYTGNVYFTFSEKEDRGSGEIHSVLPVPLGELTLMLNGKTLVENIDYYVRFPECYIVNKQYLNGDPKVDNQNIRVRYTGFCDKDLKATPATDKGFVYHGELSNDNQFDLRDGKVQRIVIDGCLKLKENLKFSEEDNAIAVLDAFNGKPYSVTDILVPMLGLVNTDVVAYRDEARRVDKIVSNYLSSRLVDPSTTLPSAMVTKYPVVSPFMNRVIDDLLLDIVTVNAINQLESDEDILNYCSSYEYLLNYDPIRDENMSDDRFVVVYPHNKTNVVYLNHTKYRFLNNIVRLYGNNRITLSPFVMIFN